MLCKHEVVGSIPSVSTNFLGFWRSALRAAASISKSVRRSKFRKGPDKPVCASQGFNPAQCTKPIDIVKRECGRLRQRKLILDGYVRQATVRPPETAVELVFL